MAKRITEVFGQIKLNKRNKGDIRHSESTFKQQLRDNDRLVSRSLVVSDYLLNQMSVVIDTSDIEQYGTDQLLRKLREAPLDQEQRIFVKFLSTLRKDGQGHVANIFQRESDELHMSDEHFELLSRKRRQICESLEPVNGLTDELVSYGVFNDADRRRIENVSVKWEVSALTIKILCRKSDAAFDRFIEALTATGQKHVVSLLLEGETSEIPLSAERRNLLVLNLGSLRAYMDVEVDLLSELVRSSVFNIRDMEYVSEYAAEHEKPVEVIKILLRKPNSAFDKFVDALCKTGQAHVVHIVTGRGEPPMSSERCGILRQMRDYLKGSIDIETSFIVDKLVASGVLNVTDRMRIEAVRTSAEKVGVMLSALERKSHSAFDKFLVALEETGQRHIASKLTKLDSSRASNALAMNPRGQQRKPLLIIRSDIGIFISGRESDISIIRSLMEQNGFDALEVRDNSIRIGLQCLRDKQSVRTDLSRLHEDRSTDEDMFGSLIAALESSLEDPPTTITTDDETFVTCTETFGEIAPATCSTEDEFESIHQTAQQLTRDLLSELSLCDHCRQSVDTSRRPIEQRLQKALSQHGANRSGNTQREVEFGGGYGAAEDLTLDGESFSQDHRPDRKRADKRPKTSGRWWSLARKSFRSSRCHPNSTSPHLQSVLTTPACARGVVLSNGKLFVVCIGCDSILVFGQRNGELLHDIHIDGLTDPSTMASCTETGELFVASSSRDSGGIWRLSSDGRHVVMLSTPPNESRVATSSFAARSLSVTSRRLLATTDVDELLLYNADSVEVRRLSLPNFDGLYHAAESPRSGARTLIVSHGFKSTARVSEVDLDGHVVRFYGDRHELLRPVHFQLDSDGRLIVADYSRHRVLLLSRCLKLERVLLNIQRDSLVTNPSCLYYDGQSGSLAVAGRSDVDSLCVQTFSVRDSFQKGLRH